jgi:two-component system OmpR family sensor kinase
VRHRRMRGGFLLARRARGHRRASLFWKVYFHGLLLLALVTAALSTVGWVFRGSGGPYPERLATYAAAQAGRDLADLARLSSGLERARETFGAEVTVYRGGEVLASNVAPPLPPLPQPELQRLDHGPQRLHGHHAFAAPIAGVPGAYVVLSAAMPMSLGRAASFALAVLLVLALTSIPLARAIAAPLERLTAAARRLGEGDLSVRVGCSGRGEVGELSAAFDEMAGRVQRLVQAERELLANVSHELRTPLARIRVALELAAAGDLEASRRYLGEIGADLSELEKLIEDVLTAARLEAGGDAGLPLRRERLPGAEVVERAAERFRAAWPGRALELQVDPSAPLPAIDADRALLRRALDNLLDNARKYSDDGAPVALRARAAGGALEVEVVDRGIGIDPADLPRIFTPFFRTDRSRARGTGGVGLGLALARRIALAHGGTLTVESVPGQGTTVRLRVPAA